VLVHPSVWHKVAKTARLVTRVNGQVKQDSHLATDMIYEPARILSWMSQGKRPFTPTIDQYYEQNGVIIVFSVLLIRHHNSRVYNCYDRDCRGCGCIPNPSTISQG
jgi:hypothetical protein